MIAQLETSGSGRDESILLISPVYFLTYNAQYFTQIVSTVLSQIIVSNYCLSIYIFQATFYLNN